MRQRLGKILLGVGVISLVAGLVGYWFWHKSQIDHSVATPYSSPDPSTTLATELSRAGITLDSAPQILGANINASMSGIMVIFSRDGDLVSQARTLQLLLPRLKMENKKITEIDLRFNKVVVR
ncbi:hypothetical protein HY440_03575 [Candidatus Microgenomates bacterium]|nr:hypothetical protein [Candidatus Microgenomates bacterium]